MVIMGERDQGLMPFHALERTAVGVLKDSAEVRTALGGPLMRR